MSDARTWLDEVDARTIAATDGPWWRDRTYPLGHAGPYSISVRSPQVTVSDGLTKRDAEFIAHARTDLPAATAALRAVLDLHRPQAPGGNLVGDDFCHGCWEAGGCDGAPLWPCPTVTAITTALEDA